MARGPFVLLLGLVMDLLNTTTSKTACPLARRDDALFSYMRSGNHSRSASQTRNQRTAFILAGAAFHMSNDTMAHFKTNVVDSFSSPDHSRTFMYVKAMKKSRESYQQSEVRALRSAIHAILRPTALVLDEEDLPYHRFQNLTTAAIKCLNMPDSDSRGVDTADMVSVWWTTMQHAHDLVARYEAKHQKAFRTVIFARADVTFRAPIGSHLNYDRRLWYSAWDPPDV